MQNSLRRLIPFLLISLAILTVIALVIRRERPPFFSGESPTEVSVVASPLPKPAPTAIPAVPLKVQLAWFYKPPQESFIHDLSQNFDFFILTHKDEPQRDQLRSLGVTGPIVQYLLLAEIRDPGSCTARPFGNQVAFHVGDFCMIDAEHPDWFLLDERGKRIGGGEVYFMDPGNPGFRAFWLDRARELQDRYGWNGIFIDNANAGLGKFRSLNVLPRKYKTDEGYQAAVNEFLEYLRTNYSVPFGRKVYANITVVNNYDIWQEYLNSLDGVLVENFAAGWPGSNKSRTEWEEQMKALEEAHNKGKVTLLVSQGEKEDANRQQFSFASYLLIANELSFFRYSITASYNEIWLYENYQINLGYPISPRYKEGRLWRRDFIHGYVTVNPETLESEIVIR